MAILMEEENGRRGPFKMIAIAVAFIILGAVTYYLFFAPAPLIEVIIPSGLQSVSQISEEGLNTPEILNSPVYKSLRQYVSDPVIGEIGRTNPFSPWTTKP